MVVLSGNANGLQAALSQATGSVSAFSKNAGMLGSALTRTVSLPLLAVGGASLKMAMDFESAMARVAGLTPIIEQSGMTIDQLSDKILEMSKGVPTGPTELANALYFAGSAGLNASDALKVTELSAQGAAVGMGEAADISKVLIFAMNAYQGSGLGAAEAMDTLTVAIREGTAEPNELAIALGRLLPVAEAAGVAFDEVVASVASLTNIGVPTRVATTALRALFAQLLAPTIRATDNLRQLGITADEMRAAVSAGPIVAFQLLERATKGNFDLLRAIIPQIRGFTAYLGLTGDRADEVRRVFDATKNSTGAFDKALKEISKTTEFQFKVSLNRLRAAGIEMGRDLFPVFKRLFAVIEDVAELFMKMPNWAQGLAAGMLVAVSAAGPLIKLWGLLTAQGKGLMSTGFSMAAGFTTMAIGAGVAVGAFSSLASGTGGLSSAIILAVTAFGVARLALAGLATFISTVALSTNRLTLGLLSLATSAPLAAGAFAILAVAAAAIIGSMNRGRKEAEAFGQSLKNAGANAIIAAGQFGDTGIAEAFEDVARQADAMGLSVRDGVGRARSAIPGMVQDIFRSSQAFRELRDEGDSMAVVLDGALSRVRGQGVDLMNVFKAVGLSVSEIKRFAFDLNGIRQIGDLDPSQVRRLEELIRLSRELSLMQDFTEASAVANIQAFEDSEQKFQQYARKFGVSVDDVKAAASSMSEDILDIPADAQMAFGEAAGWVDESTGQIVGDVEGAQEAIEELKSELRDTFIGKLFEVEGDMNINKMVKQFREGQKAARDFVKDVNRLVNRGIDPGLLAEAVKQGPEMVGALADASKGQLAGLTRAYQVTLAAVDSEILKEAAHQEVKGESMVERFSKAIEGNTFLPVKATKKIMNLVTNAFLAGDIGDKGMQFIMDFTNGLSSVQGLPPGKAGEIAVAVASAFAQGQFKGKGLDAAAKFAAGIAENKGASAWQAQEIAALVVSALSAAISGAANVGSGVTSAFVAAILSAKTQAREAGAAVAREAREGFEQASRGSPKYFTYYMGKEYVAQLNEGMKAASTGPFRRPFVIPVGAQGRSSKGNSGQTRIRMTMDNWEEGTGYLTVEAANEVGGQLAYDDNLGRMGG